ncbi:TIGR02588 family protein [Oscillatoriales cyanobacterium LEGE 11467]|uniref:TIGR02588 family protein n=1 Tax=Zarconia navalis LEGE 11467 TaxID=1828826 RepID=A0A928VX80_9CYAN|nr:TIGR02588 family protein [Zarconia navalis]MBE9041796.1 TIGR02588 family protein [Zarconia navalis LEGE 11467]
MNDSSSHEARQPPPRSIAERVSFYLSLSLLALVVSLIVYSWIDREDRPPILSIELRSEIRQVDGQFYVPFNVTNRGGKTAESVEVVAQLSCPDGVEESGSQQFKFLSSGETRAGAFIFSHNPEPSQLQVRVASYKLP